MTTVVLAEKPSMARDIASVLGACQRRQGFLEGRGYRVTWAVGHLVRLAEPHEISERWRRWTLGDLPIVPRDWPLCVATEQVKRQFAVVKRLLTATATKDVVVATDAGREGELIWRYIAALVQCDKPARRLWISSLTPRAIEEGFRALKPSAEYDRLAEAAMARSRADYLVGLNLTRFYTLRAGQKGEVFAVGRVQTPTLALVVKRDRAIQAFQPQHYQQVDGTFCGPQGLLNATFTWRGMDEAGETSWIRKLGLQQQGEPEGGAEAIVALARTGRARVKAVHREKVAIRPPELYDLTSLQRNANRLFGFTAARTLELAQTLYERHKLLSYPRTDSRALTRDCAETLADVVRAIRDGYAGLLQGDEESRPLPRRFVDDGKVTDHHALIPTARSAEGARLSEDERCLYDLVCRRLLAAWAPDCVEAKAEVVVAVEPAEEGPELRFEASGVCVEVEGFRRLLVRAPKSARGAEIPPQLAPQQPLDVVACDAVTKQTLPPKPYTDADLLRAMEHAGRHVDDEELARALRERGLGTPATRAAIVEGLVSRGYLRREGKTLRATRKAATLIGAVSAEVRSPALTGRLEERLRRIERGQESLANVLEDVERMVREAIVEGSPPFSGRTGPAHLRGSGPG